MRVLLFLPLGRRGLGKLHGNDIYAGYINRDTGREYGAPCPFDSYQSKNFRFILSEIFCMFNFFIPNFYS